MAGDRPKPHRWTKHVWDGIGENEFADTITGALQGCFPDDPPRFLARVPHGYHDASAIARDLQAGGFDRVPGSVTVSARSCADAPHIPAIAFCQGTPLRNEIEARAPSRLSEVTDIAAAAIAHRFGAAAVDGKIQAHIIAVER